MLSNKHCLPGGRAAVQVAIRPVAVDPFRQQSGFSCHFAAQCTAPACFAAWSCRDHYLVFFKMCSSCPRLHRSLQERHSGIRGFQDFDLECDLFYSRIKLFIITMNCFLFYKKQNTLKCIVDSLLKKIIYKYLYMSRIPLILSLIDINESCGQLWECCCK